MKNKEKFSNEIIDILFNNHLGVSIQTKKPERCSLLHCKNCMFNIITKDNTSCEDLAREWLEQEYVGPILDNAEKNYLGAVIKPFRDKCNVSVIKERTLDGIKHRIRFYLVKPKEYQYHIELPPFEINAMYKDMEEDTEYTLEELGL